MSDPLTHPNPKDHTWKRINRISILLATSVISVMILILSILVVRFHTSQDSPVRNLSYPPSTDNNTPEKPNPERVTYDDGLRTPDDLKELERHENETDKQHFSRAVSAVTEQAQKRSDEENFTELERNAQRLKGVSTEESLEVISRYTQKWMGSAPRATIPSEKPPEGQFDCDTAQIHEVRREKGDGDSWIYHATLVDAAGRTMEVPMYGKEGEKAWKVSEMTRNNPLVNKIYRSMVMPLIDQRSKKKPDIPSTPDS